jgi:hypothetical protein
LIVVPVVYSLVEDLKEIVRRRWGVSEEAASSDAVIA